MINYKYYIVLFCNRKKKKMVHKSAKRTTITEIWNELKTEKKPPYVKLNAGKKRTELTYELALIYPNTRWSTNTYTKDSLGRNELIKLNNDKQRVKEIIPYWEEEYVYHLDEKKRIRYHEMVEHILKITDIALIFTLNKNLFVQVENDVKMFGNKNISDSERLFEILKEDLLRKKKSNFIFVKDIDTSQRKNLYNLLESKGYKRTELFRHYSY